MPPIGFGVWFAPSEDELRIEEHLMAIRGRVVTNWRQFDLVYQRAYQLLKRKRREPLVRDIVSGIKAGVLALDAIDIEHEVNFHNHDQWMHILSGGLVQLNSLKARSNQKIEAQRQAEDLAINGDRIELDEAIAQRRAQNLTTPTPVQTIKLYDMNNPSNAPLELEMKWRKYCQLIWYLTSSGMVPKPELWIRRESMHDLTPVGRKWEFANVRSEIIGMKLDVVNRESRSDYMVALVHEDQEEIPVLINLPQHGDTSCCEPACVNLKNHLERVWTSQVIVKACLIDNPSEDNVLSNMLDTSSWIPRTNDLYLRVEPRQQ